MDTLAAPAAIPGPTKSRSIYHRLGRHAGMAMIVLMCAVSIESGDGEQRGGDNGRLGCIACAAGGVLVTAAKFGFKGCAAKACGGSAAKVVVASGSKVAIAKGAGVAAAAHVAEKTVAKTAGEAFLVGADDATLAGLRKTAPELAEKLGQLPRTPEMREIFLKENPDIALSMGRHLEFSNQAEYLRVLETPKVPTILGVGQDVSTQRTAATMKEEAYNAAEKLAGRLGSSTTADSLHLRKAVTSLQHDLPSNIRLSVSGEDGYVQIVVSKDGYTYSAKVDIVAKAVKGAGLALTAETFRRLKHSDRLPDQKQQ